MNRAENARMDLCVTYRRLYSLQNNEPIGNVFVLGWFSLAELICFSLAASRARKQAEAEAELHWRETQTIKAILTDQRLLCRVDGQWLSFYYDSISALWPDLRKREVTLEFHDDEVPPLRLTGSAVPSICVYLRWALTGRSGLICDPELASLRSAGKRPKIGG